MVVGTSRLTTGVPSEPSSITSTSTPSGTSTTTIVTVPPGAPDAVCWMAFATSSDVSKVAASESSAGVLSAATGPRDERAGTGDLLGRPGMVAEPRMAVERLFRGVFICACLPWCALCSCSR